MNFQTIIKGLFVFFFCAMLLHCMGCGDTTTNDGAEYSEYEDDSAIIEELAGTYVCRSTVTVRLTLYKDMRAELYTPGAPIIYAVWEHYGTPDYFEIKLPTGPAVPYERHSSRSFINSVGSIFTKQ